MSPRLHLAAAAVGVYFGIVLTKSEVVRWRRIHDMFLFREARMYLIIGTAILVAGLATAALRRAGIGLPDGLPIRYSPKPYHHGIVPGGILFGMGWAVTGACPGPIYAQLGGGSWISLFTLAGALLGAWLHARLRSSLPR